MNSGQVSSSCTPSLPLPTNYETMSKIYRANSFAENIIEELEKYLEDQVAEGTYDFEGNRTLLKLYLYFPHKINANCIVTILLKALCNVPQNDYIILLYMIPEYLSFGDVSSSEVAVVKQAINLIERASFEEFWKMIDNPEISSIFKSRVPELLTCLRKYIVNLYRITYRNVSISQLQASTGFQDEVEFRKWMNDNNVGSDFL